MNASDLYQEIEDALANFGLRFNEMDKMKVYFEDNQVTFNYAYKSLTIRTNDYTKKRKLYMKFKNRKIRVFWTIWAIGYNRQRSYNRKTIEFQLFIGPVVITWW